MSKVQDSHLNIRISKELLKLIGRVAKKKKTASSSWIRDTLEEAATRELKK